MEALSQIRDAISKENYDSAQVIIANVLRAEPFNPDLLNLRGELYLKKGEANLALAQFKHAVEQRLIFPRAWANAMAALRIRKCPNPIFTVTVVTPTIGSRFLAAAASSVQEQTYPFLEHVIVVDGADHLDAAHDIVDGIQKSLPVKVYLLPENTGANNFCGHRVYGAMPYLVNSDYVIFLDEDNWLDSAHVDSLMRLITVKGLAWAYSLRRIVSQDGEWMLDDDCESLGLWSTWFSDTRHLVDANCYALRRDVAVQLSPLWYRRFRDGLNPDYTICEHLIKSGLPFETTGVPTVSYRIGSTAYSVQANFFRQGNDVMKKRFPGGLPWRRGIT